MYIGIGVLVLVLTFGVALGQFFLKLNVIDAVMPHSLFGHGIAGQRDWLAGVATGLLLAMIAGQLVSFIQQLASWSRNGGSAAVVPVGGLMVALGVGVVGLLLALLSRAIATK
jgi:hypothetical protein